MYPSPKKTNKQKTLIYLNFILPNVNTDYIRQTQVMNTGNLRLIKLLTCMNILMKT